jgi:hypothetical protein
MEDLPSSRLKSRPRFQSVPRPFKTSPRRDNLRSHSPYSRRPDLTSFPAPVRSFRHRSPPQSRPQYIRESRVRLEECLSGGKLSGAVGANRQSKGRYGPECDDLDEINGVSTPSTIKASGQEETLDLDDCLLKYYQSQLNPKDISSGFQPIQQVPKAENCPERSETPRSKASYSTRLPYSELARRVSKLPPLGRGKVYHFTKTEIGRQAPL